MCLEFQIPADQSPTPMIAEEDIVCYKVLRVDDTYNKLFAPYRSQFEYQLGVLNICYDDHIYAEFAYNMVDAGKKGYEVERGFHSFITLKDAQHEINCNWDYADHRYQIFKAIIPKGAQYFRGMYNYRYENSGEDCYASSRITIIERHSA